jgi:hypothetical protein
MYRIQMARCCRDPLPLGVIPMVDVIDHRLHDLNETSLKVILVLLKWSWRVDNNSFICHGVWKG